MPPGGGRTSNENRRVSRTPKTRHGDGKQFIVRASFPGRLDSFSNLLAKGINTIPDARLDREDGKMKIGVTRKLEVNAEYGTLQVSVNLASGFEFLVSLPTTSTDKIDYQQLKSKA